ncbi:hypothetical protein H257_02850 [Aphanomyces astaci]|uniref:DDE Tnp4 domain-containing protein n=1 Tax=Aphanomyces astaci TaxID=112090 RepID=W4H109_APHAT|nr:hypothetical protein H257_02850 [Aphanomyces astaci]ETV84954.1 hypothetical protein H257_02850 [Aphanomyces astaci]|eukprot:XP_009824972.1 hypothetical protein H257_02850 [Aphanomyces astaci]
MNTLEKMVIRVIDTVQPVLYDHFAMMSTMTELCGLDVVFRNYPYAKYATDVSPEKLLVDMSAHEPGSVSDITMFRDRQDIHLSTLRKLLGSTRAMHPKKRPVHCVLHRADLERNSNVSSDPIVVENFFGRVCILWKVSYTTFVWGTKCYDAIQRLTFALTNFYLA